MNPDPEAPVSPLVAAAVAAHEMFTAYLAAGFTEDQALRLVVGTLTRPVDQPG